MNNRSDLRYLAREVSETPYFSEADGRRDPALFTLECSRPALGPYTVMASLNAIGMSGWQLLIARSLELAQRLKDRLEALDHCKVLNAGTTGIGYQPHGIDLPAWKAVLFNPRTDEAIIDRLAAGIAEMV